MKILYISYAQKGAGCWIHTSHFLSAFKAIHDNLVSYTPFADKENKTRIGSKSGQQIEKEPFREIRYILATFLRTAGSEIRELIRIKPDVAIIRSSRYTSGLLICRLLKIPLILELNGPESKELFNRFRGKGLWEWFEKQVFSIPDHIMTVSTPLKEYCIEKGVNEHQITTLPNGVDIKVFHPEVNSEKVRKKLNLEEKIVIGFSGTFAPWHGLDFLAMSMTSFFNSNPELSKNITLLLIGHPGTRIKMPDMPEKHTMVTGYIPHADMPQYLGVVDIFVAPYPKIEPFYFSPLKIFEAMSMGKPVIASSQGQITELIEHDKSGLLYPAEDSRSFYKQLHRLIENPALREQIGQNARTVIEKQYTWEQNASTVLDVCRRFEK